MKKGADQFKIIKERPGYYNDGRGCITIECADKGNVKIYQDNCNLPNKEIEKVYSYLSDELNPNEDTTALVFGARDGDGFVMYPIRYDNEPVSLNTLPEGSNAALSTALQQYDCVAATNSQTLKMLKSKARS